MFDVVLTVNPDELVSTTGVVVAVVLLVVDDDEVEPPPLPLIVVGATVTTLAVATGDVTTDWVAVCDAAAT